MIFSGIFLNILSVKAFYLLEMHLVQPKKIFFWTKIFYLVEIDYNKLTNEHWKQSAPRCLTLHRIDFRIVDPCR